MRLYRDRGLASDTSLRVNFAVELALREAGTGPVRRGAVIGPGLDVADKQEGFDFYPPQTIQPLALIDSLIRLGLADAETVRVTTFNVSAPVNDHLSAMTRRARGDVYVLHRPLEGTVAWTPELLDYFRRFGDRIGASIPVTIPSSIGPVRFRAVGVRPAIADRITARDLNITACGAAAFCCRTTRLSKSRRRACAPSATQRRCIRAVTRTAISSSGIRGG